MRRPIVTLAVSLAALGAVQCKSVREYSTGSQERYEGGVVKGNFVRSGVGEDAKLCLTLDADRLSDAPGSVSSSDGRFKATPLRPVPQFFHDPISTLSFGEGRTRNIVYAAQAGDGQDVLAVLSLMESGDVEVRLLRGAPGADAGPPPVFAVFLLKREKGAACSF
ncbi:MAG: hypothetical protein JNL38_23545 [Myxococcales bacterium]|jgi:hypothetical protein|nr:hypothetical protein [Myxococcales bacterium]